MKFLYFTDTHIRANTPVRRKDNFTESLLEKFHEIKNIGYDNKVDFYVHGGDILDRPDVPIQTIRKFSKILQSFRRPIFFVPGNHDIYAYNIESIERTALPLLDDFNVLTIMDDNSPICFSIGDTSVALHSASYSSDLDTDLGRKKYVVSEKLADFDVLLAHGMLLTKPFDLINYTLVDEISYTKADLTLCGHYHTGFSLQKVDGKLFYNPGSVARMSASSIEYDRKPKVLIVELNKGEDIKITDYYLKSAKPGSEILDIESLIEAKTQDEKFQFDKSQIEKTDFGKMLDIKDILSKIELEEEIDNKVKEAAIKLVEEVQLDDSED